MSFYIAPNETDLDILTDATRIVHAAPEYYTPRFEAIKELRELDDGTLHRGSEFRRVASLVNVPMVAVAKLMDPEWLSDKRRFYRWLAKHPEYQTYDLRGGSKLSETYVNGVPQ
jgi:hypothetical protein